MAGTTGESASEIDRRAGPPVHRERLFAPARRARLHSAATLVVTLCSPARRDPSLSTTLVDAFLPVGPGRPRDPRLPVSGTAAGPRSPTPPRGASGQVGPRRGRRRRAAYRGTSPAAGRGGGGSRSPRKGPRPSEEPSAGAGGAALAAGAAQVAGEGIQAALAKGWQAVGGDESSPARRSARTGPFTTDPATTAVGRRTPDAVSVEDGNPWIRGDSKRATPAASPSTPRASTASGDARPVPAGDKQYHPVLAAGRARCPGRSGGEVDFVETNSAADDVSFFLHYGSSNSQEHARRSAVDITKREHHAVEWTPDAIVGYINGEEWFGPRPEHAAAWADARHGPAGLLTAVAPSRPEMRVAWDAPVPYSTTGRADARPRDDRPPPGAPPPDGVGGVVPAPDQPRSRRIASRGWRSRPRAISCRPGSPAAWVSSTSSRNPELHVVGRVSTARRR
ncbi:hypothetical protein HBB16_14015 [Pseudonocardia sp. MCCB 268]|nr:hypothetical protein [Pseudonocardia cytotoxica]